MPKTWEQKKKKKKKEGRRRRKKKKKKIFRLRHSMRDPRPTSEWVDCRVQTTEGKLRNKGKKHSCVWRSDNITPRRATDIEIPNEEEFDETTQINSLVQLAPAAK